MKDRFEQSIRTALAEDFAGLETDNLGRVWAKIEMSAQKYRHKNMRRRQLAVAAVFLAALLLGFSLLPLAGKSEAGNVGDFIRNLYRNTVGRLFNITFTPVDQPAPSQENMIKPDDIVILEEGQNQPGYQEITLAELAEICPYPLYLPQDGQAFTVKKLLYEKVNPVHWRIMATIGSEHGDFSFFQERSPDTGSYAFGFDEEDTTMEMLMHNGMRYLVIQERYETTRVKWVKDGVKFSIYGTLGMDEALAAAEKVAEYK
ncbi:MAG TPA: DUF4367 domain-containing protein [Firmicutes bacterium]|nr:DUF4367 domain-containing protein [Bacillota bacterium]